MFLNKKYLGIVRKHAKLKGSVMILCYLFVFREVMLGTKLETEKENHLMPRQIRRYIEHSLLAYQD